MFQLNDLPYPEDALHPHISEQTVKFHYHKHHQGYVDKLNKKLEDGDSTFDSSASLIDIIRGGDSNVYNLAAQVWNHDFYWKCMDPEGGGHPPTAVQDQLQSAFGSVHEFLDTLRSAATGEFGSGWAWLVRTPEGNLQVMSTTDAQNPVTQGFEPLLVIDVWEHAYYLDYQNERATYVDAFCNELINWQFLEQNMAQRGAVAA